MMRSVLFGESSWETSALAQRLSSSQSSALTEPATSSTNHPTEQNTSVTGYRPGVYTVKVPEFGYDRHFTQFTTATPQNFPALGLQAGVVFSVIRMGKIWQGSALVRGFTFLSQVIALSWVKVDVVTGSTATRDGLFALHVPSGTYALQFSIPGYVTFTSSNIIVNWSDIIPVTPEPPLVESGAPFPGVALSIRASPKSTPAGIVYVLSASVSGASNTGQVSYSCSTGGGTLNATSGKAVLWTLPIASNQVSYTMVCTAKIGAAHQVSGSIVPRISNPKPKAFHRAFKHSSVCIPFDHVKSRGNTSRAMGQRDRVYLA